MMSEELVVASLGASDRDAVLLELVERIAAVHGTLDAQAVQRVLVARERIGSTGVGQGIAIPHARLAGLDRPIACFGRSEPGVEFGALDHEPVHLFMALLAPDGAAGVHLKALARASRMFKDEAFRGELQRASDRSELWRLLREKDERLSVVGTR